MSGTTSIGLGAQSVEECGCHEGTMKTQAPAVGPAERLDTKVPKVPDAPNVWYIYPQLA